MEEGKAAAAGELKKLEFSLDDPETWVPLSGKIALKAAKITFDLSEKILVIVAFGAFAGVAKSQELTTVYGILSASLAIYLVFGFEKGLAGALKVLGIRGASAFAIYFIALCALFLGYVFVVAPYLAEVTGRLVLAASS